MRKERIKERLKNYLGIEVGIEYKACLYFFCILFFYCCYQLVQRQYTVAILHMAELVLCNYIMGYAQMYVFENFDEAKRLGVKEIISMILCTAIYTAASFGFGWFDRGVIVTVIFALYMLLVYVCVFLVNKIKREWDSAQLNDMLAAFKEKNPMKASEGEKNEICNRDN